MDRRRFELATFVAAHELRNTACALAHGRVLREFFSDDEILSIAAGRFENAPTDADKAMVHFAQQIAKDASKVSAGQVQAVKQMGYSDAEIFDIAVTAAGRAFFTWVLDALGVESDSPFLELEDQLRRPVTVG